MKQIQTDKAPKAVGPYSQATEVGGLIFCAGQIGLEPKTGNLVDGIEKQAKQAMENLSEVLKAAGSSLKNVTKTTIYLADIQDFAKVNEIYGSFFTQNKPARSTIAAAALPKGALIEVDAIAVTEQEGCGDENCNCEC